MFFNHLDIFCRFTEKNGRYENDIALLRIADVENSPNEFIRLCSEKQEQGTLLGVSGMGFLSRDQQSLPDSLQETYFQESYFQMFSGPFKYESCPADKICTTNVIHNSGICRMDYGGPLYAMYCQSRIAECLYGVASYSASWTVDVSDDLCSQTTVFASVVHLKEWISSVTYQSDFWFFVQADDQIFGD